MKENHKTFKSHKKMKQVLGLLFVILLSACIGADVKPKISSSPTEIKAEIHNNLDAWHDAASKADFNAYFHLMTKDAVFIGTDASENWQVEEFKSYSKPHFDKGRAWSFSALERNIYLSEDTKIAWFDELLDTQMELCRGSGVMKLENNTWKVAHYVLSIAIPNEKVSEVIALKKESDSLYMKQLLEKVKN